MRSLIDRYRGGCRGAINVLADLCILTAFVGSIFFLVRLPNPDGINFCYIYSVTTSAGTQYLNWCYDWAVESSFLGKFPSQTVFYMVIGTIGLAVIGNVLCLAVRIADACRCKQIGRRTAVLAVLYVAYFVPLGIAAPFMLDPSFASEYSVVRRQQTAMALVLSVTSLHFIGGLWASLEDSDSDAAEEIEMQLLA